MTLPLMILASSLAAAQAPPPRTPKAAEAAPAAAPGSAQGFLDAGLKAYRQRRFTQAAAEFKRAVEADPQSAAAHFYLGYASYKIAEPTKRVTPDKEKAREEFAKAFELDPRFRPDWGRRK